MRGEKRLAVTPRQAEVLAMHQQNMKAPEIARTLGLHPNTVRSYLRQLRWANGETRFTPREAQIFEFIRSGLDVKEMAERLAVSPRTVETFRYQMVLKAKATNSAHLVALIDDVTISELCKRIADLEGQVSELQGEVPVQKVGG